MNCQECIDQLERYVDRELTDAEVAQTKRHLEECPPCKDQYQFEAGFKRLVKVCCEQEKAPAELRERLRQILY